MNKETSDETTIKEEMFPKFDKIKPDSGGWLSPSGSYYQAKSSEHDEAANFIVESNLCEIPKRSNLKRYRPTDSELRKKSNLLPRQFLNDKGWILINGPVFRTDNALNYTTKQLELLTEAGIPVVGAFDGSKEFSSRETLEWVRMTAKNVSDYINNHKIQIVENGQFKTVNQDELWRDINDRGYSTLEDFKKDPFRTEFAEFGGVEFADVRDVITKGFEDEIIFDHSMETYTLRLIRLPSGERICVEHTYHHHDRDSGNEDRMNIYVVDDFTFKDKVKRLLSSKYTPKIKGKYFKRLLIS
jgi:hypothetical protein